MLEILLQKLDTDSADNSLSQRDHDIQRLLKDNNAQCGRHLVVDHARENENVVFLKIRIPLLIGLNKKCFNGAINGIGIKICRERGGLGEFLPGGVKAAAIAVQMLTQYIK